MSDDRYSGDDAALRRRLDDIEAAIADTKRTLGSLEDVRSHLRAELGFPSELAVESTGFAIGAALGTVLGIALAMLVAGL